MVSIPYFVALIILIYAIELATNPERNTFRAVQTCRLSGGTSTEISVSPVELNMSGCLNMSGQ